MSSYQAYDHLGELGKGSYGSVTKNRHILTGDIVAIKCFVTDSKNFPSVRKSVLMECTSLRELQHDNIVRLFHVFMEHATFYLVLEFVEKTLLDVIREAPNKMLGCGPRTRSFSYQLFRALAFVHAHNYIHRDVKPENILISSSNVLKLSDLGFAIKHAYSGQRYSTYIATRWYRAPELLTGDFFYGRGIDIWAAGAVIFEMILGQAMATGADDAEQILKTIELVGMLPKYMRDRIRHPDSPVHVNCSAPFAGLDSALRGQPDAYVDFLKHCLEPDPRLRGSAESLLLHPLFRYDNPRYTSDLMAEIRQNIISSTSSSAMAYQSFLRKRNCYQTAAREILQNPLRPLTQAAVTRYRQTGLDEQIIRQMAEMIYRDRRFPVDFQTQSAELYQLSSCSGQGDGQRTPLAVKTKPKLSMYFQSGCSQPGAPKREQSVPPPGVNWRQPETYEGNSLSDQSNNPWNSFNVRKTFPSLTISETPQRTIKLQPLTVTKRCSLKEAVTLDVQPTRPRLIVRSQKEMDQGQKNVVAVQTVYTGGTGDG